MLNPTKRGGKRYAETENSDSIKVFIIPDSIAELSKYMNTAKSSAVRSRVIMYAE